MIVFCLVRRGAADSLEEDSLPCASIPAPHILQRVETAGTKLRQEGQRTKVSSVLSVLIFNFLHFYYVLNYSKIPITKFPTTIESIKAAPIHNPTIIFLTRGKAENELSSSEITERGAGRKSLDR